MRYGIAEWFGESLLASDARRRSTLADMAKAEQGRAGCPYLSNMIPGSACNKKGGVCSIRRYEKDESGAVRAADGEIVTVCPNRLLGEMHEYRSILSWVARIMLETDEALAIKEMPFLRSSSGNKAGRIDWIVMDAGDIDKPDPAWCAVETQAVYFSGRAMDDEFTALGASAVLPYPTHHRRPDWRSSGPKRLLPQLEVKVPLLRAWGKKVAVVIDRWFFESMDELRDAFPDARRESARRDVADVSWFVVELQEGGRLAPWRVIHATLDDSRKALNAVHPLEKMDFNQTLQEAAKCRIGDKVFKV